MRTYCKDQTSQVAKTVIIACLIILFCMADHPPCTWSRSKYLAFTPILKFFFQSGKSIINLKDINPFQMIKKQKQKTNIYSQLR